MLTKCINSGLKEKQMKVDTFVILWDSELDVFGMRSVLFAIPEYIDEYLSNFKYFFGGNNTVLRKSQILDLLLPVTHCPIYVRCKETKIATCSITKHKTLFHKHHFFFKLQGRPITTLPTFSGFMDISIHSSGAKNYPINQTMYAN